MTDTDAAPDAATDPDPHDCTSCGMSINDCDDKLREQQGPCCGRCGLTDTHGDTPSTYTERLRARGLLPPAEVDDDGVIETTGQLLEAGGSDAGLQQALMVAAEQGGQLSMIPQQVEFAHLCQMARMLSMSSLAPEKLREKPFDTLMILLTARDLGIPLTTGLRKISVIEGQPSLDTELQIALVRQRGLGAVLPVAENFTQEVPLYAAAIAVGPTGAPLGPPTVFTWEDAQAAGYADTACRPDAHDRRTVTRGRGDRQRTIQNSCDCKDNWRTVPRDMLWWRAAARCRRIYFPEAATGLYDPTELGMVIDVEGRLVNPETVDLPDGFVDPKQQRREREQQAEAPAAGADLWTLQERIWSLPDEIRTECREAWKANDRLGPRRSPARLPQRLLRLAKSMVGGWEAKAKSAGVDLDAARYALRLELWERLMIVAFGFMPGEQAATAPTTTVEAPAETEATEPAADTSEAGTDDGGQEPAADPGPADDETGDDDTDWGPILAEASAELARIKESVPPLVVQAVEHEVAELHWQRVNARLRAGGLPDDGPIDLRRMRVAWLEYATYEEPF